MNNIKLSKILQHWYKKNQRNLPWRHTNDPYKIWVSEIILQQTRVNQGMSYYHHFLEKFSGIEKLAASAQEDILKIWQGLGYYSRARNMHKAAKQIIDEYHGVFPGSYNELKKLCGVGDYTAAAISSFAFNEPKAVIDGNVIRFISRYFGISRDITTAEAQKKIREKAENILDKNKAGIHNQAIMEFGALQCKPANPVCDICILRKTCFALQKNKVSEIPKKKKPVKTKNRYFNYLFLRQNGYSFLQQRKENDIWKNLYEFPLIETRNEKSPEKFIQEIKMRAGKEIRIIQVSKIFRHKLSHQTIYARFYEIKNVSEQFWNEKSIFRINFNEIHKFAVSKLMDNFLSTCSKSF